MNKKALFSHDTDDWKTPSLFMNKIIDRGWIDCFPYKNPNSVDQWSLMFSHEKLYINPPFSELKLVPEYIRKLIFYKNRVLLLLPSRTDTKYFHKLLEFNPIIYFIKGRLHFSDSKKVAPFPTMLMYFTPLKHYECQYFSIFLEDFPL